MANDLFGPATITSPLTISASGTVAQLNLESDGSYTNLNATGYRASNILNQWLISGARGSKASPAAHNNSDTVMQIVGRGHTGSAFGNMGILAVEADGAPGSGSTPGRMAFYTTPSASTTAVLAGRFRANGNFEALFDATITGDLAVNGGDITSTASTMNVFSTTSTTVNAFLKATALTLGENGSGKTDVRNAFVTSKIVTFTANDTSPSVAGANIFKVPGTWTAGNNITAFDDGVAGQTITVIGGDSDCVVTDGSTLVLAGNWTAAANATLRLVYDGTDWFEIGRSAN